MQMKKTILIIAIAFLGYAAIGQVKVIDKKPINNTAKIRIQMSFEKTTKMQRDFLVAIKAEELLNDSIQFKGKIDTMFNNLWTVHSLFEYQMSLPDTIELTVIDGKFYEDTTKVDLVTERQLLVDKYNRMVEKYGELAIYDREFQVMKKRFDQIADWEKQIKQ